MHVEREESVKEKMRLSMNRSERHLIYLYDADNCAIKEKNMAWGKIFFEDNILFQQGKFNISKNLENDVNLYNFSFINLFEVIFLFTYCWWYIFIDIFTFPF